MPPIRNSCVARGSLAAGASTIVYAVPTSTAFIWKTLVLYNQSATSGSVFVQLHAGDLGTYVPSHNISIPANSPSFTSLWNVLNATDGINLTLTGGPFLYWIAGAVLPSVAGF